MKCFLLSIKKGWNKSALLILKKTANCIISAKSIIILQVITNSHPFLDFAHYVRIALNYLMDV